MADDPQGEFFYTGGIDGAHLPIMGGWNVTITHGLSPSSFYVSIPMFDGAKEPDRNGDIVLKYGGKEVTRLKDCTIDKCEQSSDGRQIWRAVILDRRYRWRYEQISGRYNVRIRNGSDIMPHTLKKPSELAKLCAEAMREKDYDVSALKDFDDIDWPEIEWTLANPAEALQALCERYNRRAIFQNNKVVVCVVGVGKKLDTTIGYVQNSQTFDPPELPGKVVLVCGVSLVQADFPIVPVGLDQDGQIKYPDQLSYRPDAPQVPSGQAPPDLKSGTVCDEKWLPWAGLWDDYLTEVKVPYLRELARAWMLKAYRIYPPRMIPGIDRIAGEGLNLGNGVFGGANAASTISFDSGDIPPLKEGQTNNTWMQQIILQPEQNDRTSVLNDPLHTVFDEYNREIGGQHLPAWVYGYWSTKSESGNWPEDTKTPVPGSIATTTAKLSGVSRINPQTVFSPINQQASIEPNVNTPDVLVRLVKDSGFCTVPFSIDPERGIVHFSEAVFVNIPPATPQITWRLADGSAPPENLSLGHYPALLWLRTSFAVADKTTRAPIRYQRSLVLDSKNPSVLYVLREDLVYRLNYRYKKPINTSKWPATVTIDSSDDNKKEIDKAADAYLSEILNRFQTRQPQTIVYPGLLKWDLDGAIRQISWYTNDRGECFTAVSRDEERLFNIRDYSDRRLAERLKEQVNGKPAPKVFGVGERFPQPAAGR